MSETIHNAILYAQHRHAAQHHGRNLRVFEDCPTCLALAAAVSLSGPARVAPGPAAAARLTPDPRRTTTVPPVPGRK